jgi:gluconolactonase
MRSTSAYLALALAMSLSTNVNAAEPRTIGSIERLDPALDKLVPADTKMDIIGEGFAWCEGPVWIRGKQPPQTQKGDTPYAADPGHLLFSDIPNNAIRRWDPKTPFEHNCQVYLKPAGYTGTSPRGGESGSNGLAVDAKGRLILCQHGDRRVALLELTPEKQEPNFVTLADRYNGKRFNSPNDAVVHSSGAIYFTDPPYGLEKNMDDPAKELDFQGVYRIAPGGDVTLLTKDLERPNGIAFSPDEKTLYVANSHGPRPIIMAFEVKSDGALGEGREFFNANTLKPGLPGACDGMTVDKDGNVFATTPGGVSIFSPDGKRLGMLATGKRTSNCEFGGFDGSVLFITADDLLLHVPLSTKGVGYE